MWPHRPQRNAHHIARVAPAIGEPLATIRRCSPVGGWQWRDAMTTSWQPTTLVQCISVKPWLTYPGCDVPGGCHDLTLGRIYEMLGVEAKGSFYRILDDSGEDYLYPASHFKPV
jgi:hypothetical protein